MDLFPSVCIDPLEDQGRLKYLWAAGKYSSHVPVCKIILPPSLEMGEAFFSIFNYGLILDLLQNRSKLYLYYSM